MGISYNPRTITDGLVLCLDAANKKSYSQNEFQYSTDIFGWSGTSANAATLSRDTISSPVGNTPLKMVVTGNDPHLGTYNSGVWNIAPAANGQTWIVSVYVKASVATTGEILIFGANSAGTAFVDGGWLSLTGVTVNIGTEWTRVQHIHTMNNANVAFIHMRLDGPNSGGTGQTVWWDGLQVERVPAGTTTPTPFTSAYYGGSVYKDLVGSNNGTLVTYPNYSNDANGSILFNSTGPYISLTQNSYGITDAYTVSFWVKRISGTGVFLYIGQSNTTGVYFESYTNTDLYTWFFGTNSPQNNGNWGANALSTTQWINVVMTMVTSTKTQTRYLNGTISGSPFVFTNTVTAPSGVSSNWLIKNNSQNWFGYISNLQLYNRALTAQEIQQNFNATRGRYGI
jgi:hypothetical protein